MVNGFPALPERHLQLPAGRMAFREHGQGDPVVCLHGNPTHSYFFRSVIAELERDHLVVAPDLLGCGGSDLPNPKDYGYRLADRVDDLEEFLETLNLQRRLTFVLHDWGGMIGLLYAARHPEQVGRIVLMNTAAFPLPAHVPFPWELWLCRLPFVGAFLVRGLNLFCRAAAKRCVAKGPLPPEVRRAYLAPYSTWSRRLAVHRFIQDIPLNAEQRSWPLMQEAEAGLAMLRGVPRLICWGEKDFIFNHHFLAEWRRHWPDAEYELYPEAGHYLLEDEPQAVPARIRRFLAEHPLAP